MLGIFSFSVNPDTKEVAFAGNMVPQQALQILQGIVIAEAVNKAKQEKQEKERGEVASSNLDAPERRKAAP